MVVYGCRVQQFERQIHTHEINEMRWHIQQIQEQHDQFMNRNHNDNEINPSLHKPHHDSSDDSFS